MIGLRLDDEAWEEVGDDDAALLEEWLVAESDGVEAGAVVASAILLKTSYEVVAPVAGTLAKIEVAAGESFMRDADLGWLEPADAGAATSAVPTEGTEPTPASAAEKAEVETIPLTGIRGAVARNMTAAWQNPRVAAGVRVEMSAFLAREAELRETVGPDLKLTPTHLLLRAVALTLAEHPRLNGVVGEDGVEPAVEVALGVAVNLEEGIIVPVLRDAATRPLAEIVSESRRLAAEARAGRLGGADLSGGTFTVSTLGATGIDWFTPVLNSPQIAILGVGAIVERPVARDGEVTVAPTMDLTLVYDHRAIDGYPASLMLSALRDRLERADLDPRG